MKKSFLLSCLILSSCTGIISNEQVEEDTLKELRKKYDRDFLILSVTNDTQGHGKGSVMPSGNVFTVEVNSKAESTTWFKAYVAYDSNKQFVYYGDTYLQRIAGDKLKKDFTEALKEGYPGHIASNLYFGANENSETDDVSGTVYFFKPYPASEKETTEYLRKFLMKLQTNQIKNVDLFVYYWDENYLKEKPIDSFKFSFSYEYHEGYFETGKNFDRRYRMKLKKEELDHLDTLNLYRHMEEL